jgi:hypothetical protein
MSAAFHTLKASFNGGELSPLLDARVDAPQHATGCRILENFIPRPYGGIMKRPGTEYLGVIGDQEGFNSATLIPFRRSTETNYVLEFGEGYLAIWKSDGEGVTYNGLTIQDWPITTWATATAYAVGDKVFDSTLNESYVCTVAHTSDSAKRPGSGASWADYWDKFYFEHGDTILDGSIYICVNRHSPASATFADDANWFLSSTYNVDFPMPVRYPTPYTAAEAKQMQYVQTNDVLHIAHPNHFPRRLTRQSDRLWVLEKVPFEFAPCLDINETTTAVQIQWDNSAIADWSNAVTSYTKGQRVLGVTAPYVGTLFTCHTAHNASTTANDEPGVGSAWTSYWNEGTSSTVVSAWAASVTYTQGQKVRKLNVVYECLTGHGSSGLNAPGSGALWTRYWKVSSGDFDFAGLTLQLVATGDVFTSDDVDSVWEVHVGTTDRRIAQELAAVTSSATTVGPTAALFVQGSFLVRTNWLANQAPIGGSMILEESFDNVTWSRLRDWALDDVNAGNISFSYDAPTVGAWYRLTATYSTNTAADKMFLEPTSSVLKLPFKITEYVSAKIVSGKVLMPNDQLPPFQAIGSSTTVYKKPAFIEAQGFPRAVTFHDSRLWWGGTTSQPARLWGSALDDFYIYLTGANDDDGIDATLASTQSNAIQWMVSQNRQMVIGTTAEEWTLDSGETDETLTPSKLRARRRTRYGSDGISPLPITDSLLWVQRGGKKVREFAYRFESDSYTAPEMTLLAEHLFRSTTIVQTAYQTAPDPVVWCVGSDGVLYGFSYDREQQITAWHRHTTGVDYSDAFESVATIYGDDGADQVWFVVNRGGFRYIERFQTTTHAATILDTLEDDGVNEDACYVDAAVAGVSGTAQTGLTHLFDRTVKAAGSATSGVVATPSGTPNGSGNVTLSAAIPSGHWIGLPFTSKLRPMKLEAQLQTGTSQARKWRINRAALNLIASCGGNISPSINTAVSAINYNGQAQPYSGQLDEDQYLNGDSSNQLDLYITHSDPTPFNLIAAVLKVEVSGA